MLNRNETTSSAGSTCAVVVSRERESARIALARAALNGLDTLAADVRNVHIQTLVSEKHFTTCGPEFELETVGERELQHGGFFAAIKLLVETSMEMNDMIISCFTWTTH